MTGRLLAAVFRQAEALAAGDAPGPDDAALVRRFARSRDEAAFAALLHRHGSMVWGVCRNLLPAEADAEDAFQATFLALVRGADGVRNPAAVGAWLHGVAVRVCTKAKRTAARRKKREEAAAVSEWRGSPPPSDDWAELHAAVHDAVGRLPDRERAVFVLCGLEGVRQPDAAARLGVKVNTVSGLLARARKRLLARLTERGLAPAAAAAAAAVGTTPAAALPDSLTDSALSLIRASADVPGIVLELARGATEGSMTGTKLLAAAVVLAAAFGVGTGAVVLSGAGAQPGVPGGPGGGPVAAPGGAGPGAGMMMGGMDAGRPTGPATGGPEPVRWEYKTVTRDVPMMNKWEQVLAKFGEDGWEVVCATSYLPGTFGQGQFANEMLLKRPKRAAAAPAGMMGAMGTGVDGMSIGPRGMGGPTAAPMGGAGDGTPPPLKGSRVIALNHLRVADLTPQIRARFSIVRADEAKNTVTVWADNTPAIQSAAELLVQLDEAAGKAKK